MDLTSWFADTAALAAIVVAVVAFIKTHVLKTLHDLATVAASLIVGAALGAAGSLLGHIDGGLPAAVAFGTTAGFLASGGYDGVKAILTRPTSTLPPSRKD